MTIVPFCTSGSSGIGSSATNLQSLAPNANWLSGQRFSGSASQDTVASWVEGLDLPEASADTEDTQTQLRLTFEDYAGSYLTQDLSTADAPANYDPQVGDVTLCKPWGNLAIFYGDAAVRISGRGGSYNLL